MQALFGPVMFVVMCALGAGSCCPAKAGIARSMESSGSEQVGTVLRGEASYYANSLRGEKTANGERYNPREKFTAANRTLPFGTRLRVTRVDTGKSVEVRVNDRGPFGRRRRILDLSRAAAAELDMLERGTVEVEAVVIQ